MPDSDYFSLLQLPRAPWIEESVVKQKFVRLSAEVHPDRRHEEAGHIKAEADRRFKALNAAYHCLREPKSRILHLLELETGRQPREVQEIPHETTNHFMEVGRVCRGVDQHLKNLAQTDSPLLKVKHFEKNMEWVDQIRGILEKLGAWREELHEKVKRMNDSWTDPAKLSGPSPQGARSLLLSELERCYRLLSYESRWSAQLQERMVRLSTAL